MSQPSLFPDATIPSPICVYDAPCPRMGRAVVGPRVASSATCEAEAITCLTCGREGARSHNLTAKGRV